MFCDSMFSRVLIEVLRPRVGGRRLLRHYSGHLCVPQAWNTKYEEEVIL